MSTLEQKGIDWVEQAPVSFSGSATTTASPEAVFAVLADHERWPEWFPVITKTEVLGVARLALRRRVNTHITAPQPADTAWEQQARGWLEELKREPAGAASRAL